MQPGILIFQELLMALGILFLRVQQNFSFIRTDLVHSQHQKIKSLTVFFILTHYAIMKTLMTRSPVLRGLAKYSALCLLTLIYGTN